MNFFPIGIDWSQYPEFIEATSDQSPSGLTAYRIPPKAGNMPNDITSFKAGQSDWSILNLPNILYVLHPPAEYLWDTFRIPSKPPMKRDAAGEIMKDPINLEKVIYDWKILPDHISTKVEGWRIEAWKRLDPRLSL
ncbi:MAG: hypothetical protein M1834_004281 [Cirrosporium novae-zelandiae]|nr:MAG: hypothetical protein M1834_004281 [Cirrosporium novae-zelandiae]